MVLQVKVDANLSAGSYEVVTGYIPGSDLAEQEVCWFVAHLDHCLPSANDNASGSAAILETARSLIDLVESGAFPKPRRTIRFFWVPEINGPYAYVSQHLEETKRAVAVINMDMVGENQMLCGSVFRVTSTHDSTPSFFNDLLEAHLDFMLTHDPQANGELTDPYGVVSPMGTREAWNARVTPYSGGSDHVVFMGGVTNIPATMFGSWPDHFYHSSGDTPDKSDPTQLKRAVVYGTMVASSIAHLDTRGGLDLLDEVSTSSIERLDEAADRSRTYLQGSELSGEDKSEALNILRWAHRREERALLSVANLLPTDDSVGSTAQKLPAELSRRIAAAEEATSRFYTDLCTRAATKPAAAPSLTVEEEAAQKMVPARNPAFPGPIARDYLATKLEEKGLSYENPFTGLAVYELGAFIDGSNSALDIRNAVSAECGKVALSDVMSYLKMLESIGLVSFKK